MANETPVDILFSAGFDSYTDPKLMRPGQLVDAVNCWQQKAGPITKRPGSRLLSKFIRNCNDGTLAKGRANRPTGIYPFGDSLIVSASYNRESPNDYRDGETLLALSDGNMEGDAPLIHLGANIPPVNVKIKRIGPAFASSSDAGYGTFGAAINGNMLLIVGCSDSSATEAFVTLYDLNAGVNVIHTQLAGGINPDTIEVAVSGNYFVVAYSTAAGTDIDIRWIPAFDVSAAMTQLSGAGAAAHTLATSVQRGYGMASMPDGSVAVIRITNVSEVTVNRLINGAIDASGTFTLATTGGALAYVGVCASEDYCGSDKVIYWNSAGGAYFRHYLGASPVHGSDTAIGFAAGSRVYSCPDRLYWLDGDDTIIADGYTRFWSNAATPQTRLFVAQSATGAAQTIPGIPICKPFIRKHKGYGVLGYNNSWNSFPGVVLHHPRYRTRGEFGDNSADNIECTSKLFFGAIDTNSLLGHGRVEVSKITEDRYGTVVIEDSTGGLSFVYVEFDFSPRQMPHALFGGGMYLGGGMLRKFDGRCFENGFASIPTISCVGNATGGSLAAGVYGVTAIFEYVDALGELHRSAPCLPRSVTVGGVGAGSITITVTPYYLGDLFRAVTSFMPNSVRIIPYLTEAGGSLYYRSPDADTAFLDITSATQNITARYASSSYAALYADYELEQFAPDGARCLCSHNGRLLVVPNSDPRRVMVSKEYAFGYSAEFAEDLAVYFTEDIQAVFGLDQSWVAAGSSTIKYFTGPGPDATGQGAWFGPVLTISDNRGIKTWRSVARVPMGVVFQSDAGWCLLDRGLNVSDLNPPWGYRDEEVLGAHVDSRRSVVIWHLANGTAIVWDYAKNAWYRWSGMGVMAMAIWRNKIVGARADGRIRIEDGFKDDETTDIPMSIETGWNAVSGPAGSQRLAGISVLGKWKSPHKLKVSVSYDYIDTVSEVIETDLSSDPGLYLVELTPGKAKCTAVKVKIEETPTGGSGESCELVGLRLWMGSLEKPISTIGAE